MIIFETTKIKRTFIHNKMHFYYFLYIFTSDFADLAVFLRLPGRLVYLVVTPSGVEPSHANRGERCAAAILTDRKQPKNKNT